MGDGEDRISALHEDLLRAIVACLPVTDAARTAALASQWRHIWRSTPLVLNDADLPEARRVAIVARVLAEHPGPFLTIRLSLSFDSLDRELPQWPRLLAEKGTQKLDLCTKHIGPLPIPLRLPADILRCSSLQSFFLSFWNFPNNLHRVADAFPNLRMLGMIYFYMSTQDLEYLLAASPVLEILALIVNSLPKQVHVSSQSLRCLLVGLSKVEEFAVVEAPLLQRLVFLEPPHIHGEVHLMVTVKIVCAPNLRSLGYLEPRIHRLQIGDNTINADTRTSPSTMVPGVKVLALTVNFGVLWEVKMLASFLRCFPNVHTLHIQSVLDYQSAPAQQSVLDDQSAAAHEPTPEHLPKFWQEVSPAECVKSGIKRMVIHKFRGDQNEFEFLKFMAMNAQELQSLLVVSSEEDFALADKVNEMINKLGCPRFRPWTATGMVGSPKLWNASVSKKASDLSIADPFY